LPWRRARDSTRLAARLRVALRCAGFIGKPDGSFLAMVGISRAGGGILNLRGLRRPSCTRSSGQLAVGSPSTPSAGFSSRPA
jgi:hypothetical protein